MRRFRTTPHGTVPVCGSVLIFLVLSAAAAGSREAVSRPAGDPTAATLSHDAERCRAHADRDACYDAVRRNPRDPALLVAMGDALQRANRPTEAIRAYRRALVLVPNFHGVAAKINAAEAQISAAGAKSRAAQATSTRHAPGNHGASSKQTSNADPVAQSH